jgi:hypothetical protein
VLSSPGLTGRSSNHRPGILDRPVKPGADTGECQLLYYRILPEPIDAYQHVTMR